MPATIKTGLLGVGHLGMIHLENLVQISDIEVIGIYDIHGGRCQEAAHRFNTKAYDSPEALIHDAQAIVVVTPTASHYDYAMSCLNRGKPVFVEKPMTATVRQAEELAEKAEATGVAVQVGHVERFNPAYLAARPFLETPRFIESHRLAQFNPRGTDVSVIYDLMIHDLDIILSLNASAVTSIHASGVSVISDTPDIANARIEFANGCVANLTASRISVKKMRKCRFFQHNAYISVDFLKKKTEVIRMKTLQGEPDPLSIVVDAGSQGRKVIHFENPEVSEANAIRTELEQFAASVRSGSRPVVAASDGFRAVQIAHEISEKIKPVSAILD